MLLIVAVRCWGVPLQVFAVLVLTSCFCVAQLLLLLLTNYCRVLFLPHKIKKVRARRGHIYHDHDAFGMSSSNRRQPKRSINPAFLVAHNRNDTSSVSAESSNFHLFAKAIDVALMTGKLSVPNNLISSLERLDRCFDLHSQKKNGSVLFS